MGLVGGHGGAFALGRLQVSSLSLVSRFQLTHQSHTGLRLVSASPRPSRPILACGQRASIICAAAHGDINVYNTAPRLSQFLRPAGTPGHMEKARGAGHVERADCSSRSEDVGRCANLTSDGESTVTSEDDLHVSPMYILGLMRMVIAILYEARIALWLGSALHDGEAWHEKTRL